MKGGVKLLLTLAILVTAALAGCTSDTGSETDSASNDAPDAQGNNSNQGGDGGDGSDSGGGGDGSDGGDSGDGGDGNDTAPANQPPSATLSASKVNGSVPLNVTFDLSGSDPDGDSISWSLDFGDDSEAVQGDESTLGPYPHTFNDTGVYEVLFTVRDGEFETVKRENITVVPAAEEEPNLEERSCTVVVGAAVISLTDMGIGGCGLGAINGPTIYYAHEIPSGCQVNIDIDGDTFADEQPQPGNVYEKGSMWMSCGPGVADATGTIWLQPF